jgi:hypothetical protein
VDGPTSVAAKPELHKPAHQRRVVDDEDRARHTLLARRKLDARGRRAIVVADRVSGGARIEPGTQPANQFGESRRFGEVGPPALSNACTGQMAQQRLTRCSKSIWLTWPLVENCAVV